LVGIVAFFSVIVLLDWLARRKGRQSQHHHMK
jgi:hypothetical protein